MEESKFTMQVKEFRKMVNPNNSKSNVVKYVCYAQCKSLDPALGEWMGTNPREQKMTTNVAKKIAASLENNQNFHELNRGLVFSVDSITYDNQKGIATFVMNDPDMHGDIDGGHTLRAIFELRESGLLYDDRYVFVEFFTGLTSTVELAEARNTSVQVDLKSIEELKNSFETLKSVFAQLPFSDRIQYKMNEYYDEKKEVIDVREAIAILSMFSQEMYPVIVNGSLAEVQPIQCYSGKEATLRKFLGLGREERDTMIKDMAPIIGDIFKLWEVLECTFTQKTSDANKRYGTRKYSRYNGGAVVGQSFLEQHDLTYIIPKGIMYPLVGAFRALVVCKDHKYSWRKPPLEAWNALGSKLTSIILDEKMGNPDMIAKNNNLWSNLLKEVYIYGYIQ